MDSRYNIYRYYRNKERKMAFGTLFFQKKAKLYGNKNGNVYVHKTNILV